MKNRIAAITICIVAVALCAMLLLTSCVPPASNASTTTTSKFVTTETFNTELAKKANTNDVVSIAEAAAKTQIDGLNLDGSGVDAYSKSQVYTKAQVDAIIEELKDDQSWITGSTYTSEAGTTVSDLGEEVDSDGTLVLWLEKVGGDADSETIHTSDGDNSCNFILNVQNTDLDSRHYFYVHILLTLQNGEDAVTLTSVTPDSDNVMALTAVPDSGSIDEEEDIDLKSNKLNVYKDDVETYRIYIDIDQSAGGSAIWDLDFRVDDKGD